MIPSMMVIIVKGMMSSAAFMAVSISDTVDAKRREA